MCILINIFWAVWVSHGQECVNVYCIYMKMLSIYIQHQTCLHHNDVAYVTSWHYLPHIHSPPQVTMATAHHSNKSQLHTYSYVLSVYSLHFHVCDIYIYVMH